MREVITTVIEVTSAALIVAGVAAIYWPAALIVAGAAGLVISRQAVRG
ncbi:hypothetical protein QT381_02595 [Galbitalea sp. SE-J8]|nr:hypothetical protein [Galbitalea sp. SE-J8]MDM4761892.1 hypothetical protein [Galbitalea sp. SE-J8]